MALTFSTNHVVVFCKDTSLPDSNLSPERPSLLYVRGGERKGRREGGGKEERKRGRNVERKRGREEVEERKGEERKFIE